MCSKEMGFCLLFRLNFGWSHLERSTWFEIYPLMQLAIVNDIAKFAIVTAG